MCTELGLNMCTTPGIGLDMCTELGLDMCTELGLNMCTRTGIKHVYLGVQGACPWQAVTSTGGMPELARAVP